MQSLNEIDRMAVTTISEVFIQLFRRNNPTDFVPTHDELILAVEGFAQRNLRLKENELEYLIRCAQSQITHSMTIGKSIMSFREFVEKDKKEKYV